MPVAGIFHEKLKIHHASHAGFCCCYLEDRSIQPSMKIARVDSGELVIQYMYELCLKRHSVPFLNERNGVNNKI